MQKLNLTLLGGLHALTSGTGTGGRQLPVAGGSQQEPPSFNYSVVQGHGHLSLPGSNQSMLLLPPPDYSKLFGNGTPAGFFHNVSLELAGTLSPCSLVNDTTGATCNFTLLDNATVATTAATSRPHVNPYSTLQLIVLSILAGSTCIATIVGNLIVIMSFIIERTIRQPTNYFIASLAMSDLLIGTFSMPFYTIYLLTGKYWPLGEVLCDLWLSVDYTVCLTSIYTVFCITIDRFCSVKIPAKYRTWRTDTKVTVVITLTWVIPIMVFFTSIFGWQYFVGQRTVPEGMCYVQYMEDALFNCVLQLGYFWVTLTVMCVLYTGIYKVALDLQRKSEAKAKKMTSLVSMAGQTMTKIGIGMSKHQNIDSKRLFERSDQAKADGSAKKLEPGLHSTTSFSSKHEKEDDRSSSPAFPSDTDQSSQSPKHTAPARPEGNNNHSRGRGRRKKGSNKTADTKQMDDTTLTTDLVITAFDKASPGLANSAFTTTSENNDVSEPVVGNTHSPRPNDSVVPVTIGNNVAHSPTSPAGLPHNSIPRQPNYSPSSETIEANVTVNPVANVHTDRSQSSPPVADSPADDPPPYPGVISDRSPTPQDSDYTFPPPPTSCTSDPEMSSCHLEQEEDGEDGEDVEEDQDEDLEDGEGDEGELSKNGPTNSSTTAMAVTTKPDCISGLKYIDQDSLKSPLSNDNIRFMAEPVKEFDSLIVEEPDSPIWKRRSLVERETRGNYQDGTSRGSPASRKNGGEIHVKCLPSRPKDAITANFESAKAKASMAAAAHVHVESTDGDSKTVSRLAKPDEIQPLNADDGSNSKKRLRQKAESPLRGLIKSVGSRKLKRGRSKKEKQQKSKSENRARKALRVITIILGAFVLCWTPWHILSMIMGFCPDDSGCVEPTLYDISYWLCYLNSPINPLCYAFANQQFKKTFIRILRLDWHRT